MTINNQPPLNTPKKREPDGQYKGSDSKVPVRQPNTLELSKKINQKNTSGIPETVTPRATTLVGTTVDRENLGGLKSILRQPNVARKNAPKIVDVRFIEPSAANNALPRQIARRVTETPSSSVKQSEVQHKKVRFSETNDIVNFDPREAPSSSVNPQPKIGFLKKLFSQI